MSPPLHKLLRGLRMLLPSSASLPGHTSPSRASLLAFHVRTRLRTNEPAPGERFPRCYPLCQRAVPRDSPQTCLCQRPQLPSLLASPGVVTASVFVPSELSSSSEGQRLRFACPPAENTFCLRVSDSPLDSFPAHRVVWTCQRTQGHTFWCPLTNI